MGNGPDRAADDAPKNVLSFRRIKPRSVLGASEAARQDGALIVMPVTPVRLVRRLERWANDVRDKLVQDFGVSGQFNEAEGMAYLVKFGDQLQLALLYDVDADGTTYDQLPFGADDGDSPPLEFTINSFDNAPIDFSELFENTKVSDQLRHMLRQSETHLREMPKGKVPFNENVLALWRYIRLLSTLLDTPETAHQLFSFSYVKFRNHGYFPMLDDEGGHVPHRTSSFHVELRNEYLSLALWSDPNGQFSFLVTPLVDAEYDASQFPLKPLYVSAPRAFGVLLDDFILGLQKALAHFMFHFQLERIQADVRRYLGDESEEG